MSQTGMDADEAVVGGSRRNRTVVAWGLLALYVVASALTLWLDVILYSAHAPAGVGRLAWLANELMAIAGFAAFAVIGTLIVSRRDRNPVGGSW